MHGLPENINLDFLKGKKLIQICISVNQITVVFDDNICIHIESVLELFDTQGALHRYEDNRSIDKEFLMLLERPVSKVTHNKRGTLKLHFENGIEVKLSDDSNKYESYRITGNGETIIV